MIQNPPCDVDGCPRPSIIGRICAVCRTRLADDLTTLIDIRAELEVTATRQDVTVKGAGGGTGLAYASDEADLLWVLQDTLRVWAWHVASGRDLCPMLRRPDSAARWLRHHLDLVIADTLVGQVCDELAWLARACERAIDVHAERVYAGPCDQCARDMYARVDAPSVTCCGVDYDVAARRDDMLAKARAQQLPAVEVCRALALFGTDVNAARIRKWKERGVLEPAGFDARLRPLYLVADVEALLAAG